MPRRASFSNILIDVSATLCVVTGSVMSIIILNLLVTALGIHDLPEQGIAFVLVTVLGIHVIAFFGVAGTFVGIYVWALLLSRSSTFPEIVTSIRNRKTSLSYPPSCKWLELWALDRVMRRTDIR